MDSREKRCFLRMLKWEEDAKLPTEFVDYYVNARKLLRCDRPQEIFRTAEMAIILHSAVVAGLVDPKREPVKDKPESIVKEVVKKAAPKKVEKQAEATTNKKGSRFNVNI